MRLLGWPGDRQLNKLLRHGRLMGLSPSKPQSRPPHGSKKSVARITKWFAGLHSSQAGCASSARSFSGASAESSLVPLGSHPTTLMAPRLQLAAPSQDKESQS